MAQSKLISAFLFLVFILSQQIQSIEGKHLREGKKSFESKTIQTQSKIYEIETIKHSGVLHGDDKSNEEITSMTSVYYYITNCQCISASSSSKSWRHASDPQLQVTDSQPWCWAFRSKLGLLIS